MAEAKPIKVIRVGGIQLSVWENAVEKGVIRSVSIAKSYKDKSGNWQTTSNFKGQDLPLLVLGLEEVMRFLYLKEETGGADKVGESPVPKKKF